MAKNWAITIGINKYDRLQPLNYAKRDAQLMHDFLVNEASFEKVYFFSDDSPDVAGKSTRPNRANLRGVLRELFRNPFMDAGDNFWFFFSGHGIRHNNRDYLMPCDGDAEDIEETAIPINFVTEQLRQCGADNIVLILDACRNLAQKGGEGIGKQTVEEARQQGIISIFSCSPQEYSYEIPALQQGAFTRVLLDGLGIQGKCATVERLNQYLSLRVPEIVRQHHNGKQTPYIIAEPVNKSHLILVPRYATLAEIATLKNDAYRAQMKKDFDLAKQLWIRVLAAASGSDIEAIEALEEIARSRCEFSPQSTSPPNSNTPNSSKEASLENTLQTESESPPGKIQKECQITNPVSQDKPKNSLIDDKDGDYKRLDKLLKSGNWKEADQETKRILLGLVNREMQAYLSFESASSLPVRDLYVIDRLWNCYSNGLFGFSVQKQIWQMIGGKVGEYNEETWFKFGEIVGWRSQRKHQIIFATWTTREWSYYSDIKFSLDVPKGHLPRLWDEWRGGIELLVIFSKI
jgi:uncharacterized caspase-like protein